MSELTPSPATFDRKFTAAGGPFDGISFVRRASRIGTGPAAVFEMDNVEVPNFWDQVATDILASKYLRKAGVPLFDESGVAVVDDEGSPVAGAEHSMRQVALRMANAWQHWGSAGGYFASDEDASVFRDELAYMLVRQMAAPNSPQWFNTGLFEAYGIVEDSEGNFFWDPVRGEAVLSAHKYERSAANACFILNVEDQLVGEESIMRHIEDAARLFKGGSGVGANYSKIRELGGTLTGGGTSSGVMSFLRVHDRAAGAIKSGGTTRRAAKMVLLDVDHPDIEMFIVSKVLEERKAAALGAAGYSLDFNGEAYDTVAFQNANHSVRVSAAFMAAVRSGGQWPLLARRDGAVVRIVDAAGLWRQIAEAAWASADPGVQFDDILNAWNTAADTERVRATNPCAEYTHVDNTACNLASLNLLAFWDDQTGKFNVEAFEHAVRLWTYVLEITVAMSHYPTAVVAERSFAHRTLGLGYANLGALLMRVGLAYDSDEARAVIGAITSLMTLVAYRTSAEMAKVVGVAEAYPLNAGGAQRVLRNHVSAALGERGSGVFEGLPIEPQSLNHALLASTPFGHLSDRIEAVGDEVLDAVSAFGLRNMQVTVLAPTGTIGLVMGCDTTGVEPDFALVKLKRLSGGGTLRIVNQSVLPALAALGYDEAAIERIRRWTLGTSSLEAGPVDRQRLTELGFTEGELAAAESVLGSVSAFTEAFDAHVIGDEAFDRAGLPGAGSGRMLLGQLGISERDLAAASLLACGHLTVEGAPDLNPEHLSVFDCAVECGDGTRVIPWEGHVRALGAAAPFLSGAISKTVNLANSATVDDVVAVQDLAYELGVKCVAVYRDGSKMSQPLNSAQADSEGELDLDMRSPTSFYRQIGPQRFRLPNVRVGVTWRLDVAGEKLYLRSGEYEDGTLGEIFLDWGKSGSTLRGMTSAMSIVLSQALQHGVPLEHLVRSLRGHSFEPHGVVSGHPHLKMASSVVDAVIRILGHHYLGDDSLVQVKGPPSVTTGMRLAEGADPGEVSELVVVESVVASAGPVERVYGETCVDCGSADMTKSGTCWLCLDCGSTTGCS